MQSAEAQFDRIDMLVSNAGCGYQASIKDGEGAQIRALFDVDVFGLFRMRRNVLPGIRKNRSGHVLNTRSVAGLVGLPGFGY